MMANGTQVDSILLNEVFEGVEVSEDGNTWSYTWMVDKYAGGKVIVYSGV